MSNNRAKNNIRASTRKQFPKKGMCEMCGIEDVPTTFHHKKYIRVCDGLKRKDVQELCIPCHRRQHKNVSENASIIGAEDVVTG